MSITIRPNERVGRAIRRVVRAHLSKAADTLTDGGLPLSERIHLVRTSIKKVRALVALAEAAAPRQAHRADRRLRRLAGASSELRDAEIVLATLDEVMPRPRGGLEQPRALGKARAQLVERLRTAEQSFTDAGNDEGNVEDLAKRLLDERHRADRWAPTSQGHKGSKASRNDWDRPWDKPCIDGASRSYKRARRAMAWAYQDLSSDAFHSWRKAVKAHRYQLQFLLGPLALPSLPPSPLTSISRIADLEALGEELGAEHDLAILEETMDGDRGGSGALLRGGERGRLSAAIARRRRGLRARARSFGDRLFADPPRVFRRRLEDDLRQANRKRQAGRSLEPPSLPRGGNGALRHDGLLTFSEARDALREAPSIAAPVRRRLTVV